MAQLLSNLPIGAKVKFGRHSINGETPQSIVWRVVSKSDNITMLSDKIIDFRAFDAREVNYPDGGIVENGNNRYSLSNIAQWLNSDAPAGKWFTPTHAHDLAPNGNYVDGNTPYEHRPGFLYHFSEDEKNVIAITSVVTQVYIPYSSATDVTPQKVFLPSVNDMNGGWAEFTDNNSRICGMTEQARANTQMYVDDTMVSSYWWLRDPAKNTYQACYVMPNGHIVVDSAADVNMGGTGIRPAINLLSTLSVSDSTDSEGVYTILWNAAPTTPIDIVVPTIYGGKSNLITWGISSDINGDTVTYCLECSVDSSEYIEVYRGLAANYTHLVPFGTSTMSYRVKATDPSGESSAYTTSATINVINNNAPTISGSDGNLGVKSSGFTGTYTITDANSDTVTVTEAIDGVRIRSLVATLGEEITYGVTENTWLALPNGSHTLTISATDGIDTTVRTIVFTKLVDTLKIQNSTPWAASTMPSRIMLVITRNVPSAATFKVEVCNNGYDASPTWEDCTDAVRSGLVHVFTNTIKRAVNWGVLVRVTVARNGATGACYISAIGGNFE